MKPLLFLFLAGWVLTAGGAEFAVASGGRARCAIVLPDAPTPVETTAAGELAHYLEAVTGAEFAITPESAHDPAAPAIHVGATANFPGRLPEGKRAETVAVRCDGKNLWLNGSPGRGVLYAATDFLENAVGVRWWTSTEEYVPERPELTLDIADGDYSPKFFFRSAWYRDTNFGDPRFAARLKLNGPHHKIAPEWGGNCVILGWAHTFHQLLPPDRYFADHPEWYSYFDGKRQRDRSQLCLTNPAMRAELVANALALLRENPGAEIISISQNDWNGWCQCEECEAEAAKLGGQSDLNVWFVNAVAAELEGEFPGILVHTFAYMYTRSAPKSVRPAANVLIQFCTIERSVLDPLGEGPGNADFRRDLEAWSKIADDLFIWDYVANFRNYLLPHPNYRTLGPDVRWFAAHPVAGVFVQGDGGCAIGDFSALRAWLSGHLLWRPESDAALLAREFLSGYYGAAGPALGNYLDFLAATATASGVRLGCMEGSADAWLAPDKYAEAYRLYGEASAAALASGDPAVIDRVRRERLTLDHAYLAAAPELRRRNLALPVEPLALLDDFLACCERYGVGEFREQIGFDTYGEELRTAILHAAEAPEICRGIAPDRWMDYQEKQLSLSMVDQSVATVDDELASNRLALRMPGDKNWWPIKLVFNQRDHGNATWRIFAALRAEAASDDGSACTVVVYDENGGGYLLQYPVPLSQLSADRYTVVEAGKVVNPPAGSTVVVTTPNRPLSEVAAVYVDRIFLVRE